MKSGGCAALDQLCHARELTQGGVELEQGHGAIGQARESGQGRLGQSGQAFDAREQRGTSLRPWSELAREDAEEAPVCKRAMVSPGTGTVLCIDPLGAPVEAPPPQEEPCKPGKQTGGIWTPGSGCSEE